MANKVPNTNNFSLQDVVNVVKPTVNTLESCFENSIDSYFDTNYKGDKNSLYCFRNYGQNTIILKSALNQKFGTTIYNTIMQPAYPQDTLGHVQIERKTIRAQYSSSEYGSSFRTSIARGFIYFPIDKTYQIDINKMSIRYLDSIAFWGDCRCSLYGTSSIDKLTPQDFLNVGDKFSNTALFNELELSQPMRSHVEDRLRQGQDLIFMIRIYKDIARTQSIEYISEYFDLQPNKIELKIN